MQTRYGHYEVQHVGVVEYGLRGIKGVPVGHFRSSNHYLEAHSSQVTDGQLGAVGHRHNTQALYIGTLRSGLNADVIHYHTVAGAAGRYHGLKGELIGVVRSYQIHRVSLPVIDSIGVRCHQRPAVILRAAIINLQLGVLA